MTAPPAVTEPPAVTGPPATDPPLTPEPTPVAPEWRELGVTGGPSPRSDHTWTVAADGAAAYLFGGRTGDGASNEVWEFNLTSDTWQLREIDGPSPEPRWGHTATWVPDVGLVIWSGQSQDGFFADVWRFDPTANAWEQLPSSGATPEARYGSCASLGPDGRLWISHGFTNDGRFADTRAYDFGTGEWTDETPSGRVPVERCLHDCFWTADGAQLVLYAGQTTGVPALGDAWAYDLATGDWTASTDGAAPARQLYAMAPTGDGAVIFGGGSLDGGFLNDALLLDASTLGLTPLDVPAGPSGRAGATLIEGPAGRLLLFGGIGADGALGDLWEIGTP